MIDIREHHPHADIADLCLDLGKQKLDAFNADQVTFLGGVRNWQRKGGATPDRCRMLAARVAQIIKVVGMSEQTFFRYAAERAGHAFEPSETSAEPRQPTLLDKWHWYGRDARNKRLCQLDIGILSVFYGWSFPGEDKFWASCAEITHVVFEQPFDDPKFADAERAVRRSINRLVEAGYVRVKRSNGGRNRRNEYSGVLGLAEARHAGFEFHTKRPKRNPDTKPRVYAGNPDTEPSVSADETLTRNPGARSTSGNPDTISGYDEREGTSRFSNRYNSGDGIHRRPKRSRVRLDDDQTEVKDQTNRPTASGSTSEGRRDRFEEYLARRAKSASPPSPATEKRVRERLEDEGPAWVAWRDSVSAQEISALSRKYDREPAFIRNVLEKFTAEKCEINLPFPGKAEALAKFRLYFDIRFGKYVVDEDDLILRHRVWH